MSQPVPVRVDSKGRLTVPRTVCRALGVEVGDLFLLEQEGQTLRLVRAATAFDALAREAQREFHAGETCELREFARQLGSTTDAG